MGELQIGMEKGRSRNRKLVTVTCMAFGGTDFRTDRGMKTEITPILHIKRSYREANEADEQSNMAFVSDLHATHSHTENEL